MGPPLASPSGMGPPSPSGTRTNRGWGRGWGSAGVPRPAAGPDSIGIADQQWQGRSRGHLTRMTNRKEQADVIPKVLVEISAHAVSMDVSHTVEDPVRLVQSIFPTRLCKKLHKRTHSNRPYLCNTRRTPKQAKGIQLKPKLIALPYRIVQLGSELCNRIVCRV
jgi:hypothetical protein